MNKQELSCPGTADMCKELQGGNLGFFDEVFSFFGITEITGHTINDGDHQTDLLFWCVFSSLVKVMQHQDDSHYRS